MNDTKNQKINISYEHIKEIYSDQFMMKVLTEVPDRNYLWHVAVPKSGSTWLTSILSHAYAKRGVMTSTLLPDTVKRSPEIDPRRFITPKTKDVFFRQQHCMYSPYTEKLIKATKTKIVFQYRNLFDTMASLCDHIDDAIFGSQSEMHEMPQGILNNLERSDIPAYVLDTNLPWYCQFLDGWLSSDLIHSENLIAVRYETLRNSAIETLKDISGRLSLGFTQSELEEAIKSASQGFTRMNKGINGRGKTIFSKQQKQRIIKCASYYNIPSDLLDH